MVYNSFLPQLAGPDDRDKVSSRGWALGYLGGGLLLLLNLVAVTLLSEDGNDAAHARPGPLVASSRPACGGRVFTLLPLLLAARTGPPRRRGAGAGGNVLTDGFRQLGRHARGSSRRTR